MILQWALHLLIGCGIGLWLHPIWILPLVAIQWKTLKKMQGIAFCCLGFVLTILASPPLQEGSHQGSGIFRLDSIAPANSPFHRSLIMRGALTAFESDGEHYQNLPCVIFTKKAPKAAKRYYIEGIYEEGRLKLGKRPIQVAKAGTSIPLIRFSLKDRVRKWCKRTKDAKVGHFYASMLTGDVDDRLLAMEFRKWGLSHVLAISGFHFALIGLGFGCLIRWTLPSRYREIALMTVLTGAFLYFGPTASITRAYVMISLFLLGRKLVRSTDPLQLLGAALLVELLTHPLHAAEIGFQLSYGATFGILTFFSPIKKLIERLFPPRTPEALRHFSLLDQHGYLALSFIKNGLALSLAVHVFTLPLLLYHFGTFPLLSPIFNLFLPALLSLCILGIPLGPINQAFTRFVLTICSHTPENFNFQWHLPTFPPELAVCLIALLGTLGLTLTGKMSQNSVLSSHGDRSSVG